MYCILYPLPPLFRGGLPLTTEPPAAPCHARRKKKETEAEAHLFGDKEAYVTNAYRKHQAEQAQFAADLNQRCAAAESPTGGEPRAAWDGFFSATP